MTKRGIRKLTSSKQKRLRRLIFDSLEDRRLLAGLSVSIFEDVNASGQYENESDRAVASQVAFLDINQNGQFDSDERYSVSDAEGIARFENLDAGSVSVGILGQSFSPVSVELSDSQDNSLSIPVALNTGNEAPQWRFESVEIDSVEDTSLDITSSRLNSYLINEPTDSTYYFVSSLTSHGELTWSRSQGGIYVPTANFFGSDNFVVRAFDGQAWSNELLVNLKVAGVDDLPTALRVTFEGSVPENVDGALLATYEVDDVDQGAETFYFTQPDMFQAANGEIRLLPGRFLNYELGGEISVGIRLLGNTDYVSQLTAFSTIAITNQNDVSLGVEFLGIPQVTEFKKGYNFGNLKIIDEDVDEDFVWKLSDDRFFIDDDYFLRLQPGTFLESRKETSIPLVLTATSVTGGDSISTEIAIRVTQAPPSFQNQSYPLDVNNDGYVSSLDALAIINSLNARGSRDLSGPPPNGRYDFIDVNGDRVLSSLDILTVINHLNYVRRTSNGGGSGPSGSNPLKFSPTSPANNQLDEIVQQIAAAQSFEYQEKLRRSL